MCGKRGGIFHSFNPPQEQRVSSFIAPLVPDSFRSFHCNSSAGARVRSPASAGVLQATAIAKRLRFLVDLSRYWTLYQRFLTGLSRFSRKKSQFFIFKFELIYDFRWNRWRPILYPHTNFLIIAHDQVRGAYLSAASCSSANCLYLLTTIFCNTQSVIRFTLQKIKCSMRERNILMWGVSLHPRSMYAKLPKMSTHYKSLSVAQAWLVLQFKSPSFATRWNSSQCGVCSEIWKPWWDT
jgi:hypothetical protein